MNDLHTMLRQIERDLDAGVYRPGPWAAFLQQALRRPEHERAAIAADVSRVSNKLHQRRHRRMLPFSIGFGAEVLFTGIGLLLLRISLQRNSRLALFMAAWVLTATSQPLGKVTVGSVLGIRYAYMYFQGGEPSFKMHYGTYLAAPHWKRVLVQLAGTVGSPLALWLVGASAMSTQPGSAKVCRLLSGGLAILQVALFLAGLTGVKRVGRLETVRSTSGGAAGGELRDILLERKER